jgi:hypothetical protein
MVRFSKHALVFLLFSSPVFAQHLDFGFGVGVKGGFPFTDFLESQSGSEMITTVHKSSDYIVGPVAELRIPFGFAAEVNALYRDADYRITTNDLFGTNTYDAHPHSWEFPYMAKFRFPIPLLKPFVSAGGVYRTLTVPNDVTGSHNGVVLGGGLELRIKRLRLSGEARWLHYGSSSSNPGVRIVSNQGEFLLGVIF